MRTRRLKLKSLEEATGLAVWLAQTNSLLQALLPSFYCAFNSLDSDYVAPAGGTANANQVWAELEDAVYLSKQLCLDYSKFTAAFTASVTKALSPLEQVALGVPRLVWQTDATGKDPLFEGGKKVMGPNGKPVFRQGVFGLALFGLKAWGAALVEDYEKLLQGVVGLDRERGTSSWERCCPSWRQRWSTEKSFGDLSSRAWWTTSPWWPPSTSGHPLTPSFATFRS